MDDQRVGAVFRAVRIRRGLRQADVASRGRVSSSMVSLIEPGHIGSATLNRLRSVANVLEIRLDVLARWRGGDLDRLLSSKHAALTEDVARWITGLPGWAVFPELSFAYYGERGVIDLLAWHASSRTLLVIGIKTEIVDLQEMLGTLDQKKRFAAKVGRDRGWNPRAVATWLVVAESTANRRHVAAHRSLVRSALPASGFEMRTWLRHPSDAIHGCSFGLIPTGVALTRRLVASKRVRPSHRSTSEREPTDHYRRTH
jgi:transcriptional regulator with XRE-family HTH domain